VCGRFGLTQSPRSIARLLGARLDEANFQPRYNIAPTQQLLSMVNDDQRSIGSFRWGLVPWWSEGPKAMKLSTFNARIETIATSRVYREALRERRCAIFADGYFEWFKEADGSKTPVWIYRKDRQPFVFAGLWETWRARDRSETLKSCTIITQPPNDFAKQIHSRMPVVLEVAETRKWLEPSNREPESVIELLSPSAASLWTAHDVDRRVGNVRYDDASLIAAVSQFQHG